MTDVRDPTSIPAHERLPLGGLLILALCGFVTLMTEVMPAGLLAGIGRSLAISQSAAGQLVTAYALGSSITAIPLMALSHAIRRRRLLLTAMGGFAVVNMITALSSLYWLTLCARLLAGTFGGIVWALLVGYAVRLAPERLAGRAIAIAGGGAPLALSVGVPAGTWFGTLFDWRAPFGLMSLLALALVVGILAMLPDPSADGRAKPASVSTIVKLPGLTAIFGTMFVIVFAHNCLYTYIAPFLALSGLDSRVGSVLLVFGLAAMVGLWIAGSLVDRHLRATILFGLVALGAAALALCLANTSALLVFASVSVWGLVLGGAPALFQAAEARVAGDATDVAQAMFVTIWNAGVAGGGILGGLLIEGMGPSSLPEALLLLTVSALLVATRARRHGFPSSHATLPVTRPAG